MSRYAEDGTPITVPVDTPIEWSSSGVPSLGGVEIGPPRASSGLPRSLSRKMSRRAAAPLLAGAMPDVLEVVREDGAVVYAAGRAPDGTAIEITAQAIVGRLADGTPVFAEGTVVGFTEDGVAIVADGFGGTREDRHAGGVRVDASAIATVMSVQAARVQAARDAGLLPSAAEFVVPGVRARARSRVCAAARVPACFSNLWIKGCALAESVSVLVDAVAPAALSRCMNSNGGCQGW